MNKFEDWHKSVCEDDEDDYGYKFISKQAWEACKKEMLDLLKKELNNSYLDSCNPVNVVNDLIKNIEENF